LARDLGTYHLRVELESGEGWIETVHTGWRYCDGTPDVTHLQALAIPPTWDNEADMFSTVVYGHLEGNYSCDCNKAISLARAHQREVPEDPPCGDTMILRRLTAIRPDRTEVVLWEGPWVEACA
jgi:hypothetical protein